MEPDQHQRFSEFASQNHCQHQGEGYFKFKFK